MKLKHLLKYLFLAIIFDKIILQHKLKEFSKNLVKDFEDRFSRVFSAHAGCSSSLKGKNEANGYFGQKEYTTTCHYEFSLQLPAHLATRADCIIVFLETIKTTVLPPYL